MAEGMAESSSTRPVVVVGGGLAAGTVVTELREGGYDGPVVVFTDEAHPPYERPPLSKDFLLDKGPLDAALVHPEDWYAEHAVDLHTSTPVTAIDPEARTVTANGGTTPYSALVLATGSRARHLPLADDAGAEVHYLRQWDDAERLRAALTDGSRLAIIGGGWIGLEVASAARKHGVEVTILEMAPQPLHAVLGDEVASLFADLHRAHGVDLRTGVTIDAIRRAADGGFDGGVEIDVDGDTVTVDRLVVGVGAVPDVSLAEAAGITVENGVRTDSRLRTSAADVYAAGDVANADHPVLGRPLRVEHWDTAIQHGKVVAANILGRDTEHDALPYFFTDQYDLGMEYVGNPGPEGFDRVVVRGTTGGDDGGQFTAWWLRDGTVVAGMHANDWDAIDQVRRIVGTSVDPDRLADDQVDLADV
jgi:3-phenylpropionate/trans-cinnamate dioxygenase ferredoxin reductase subunit